MYNVVFCSILPNPVKTLKERRCGLNCRTKKPVKVYSEGQKTFFNESTQSKDKHQSKYSNKTGQTSPNSPCSMRSRSF
jgi:hypothetical protein